MVHISPLCLIQLILSIIKARQVRQIKGYFIDVRMSGTFRFVPQSFTVGLLEYTTDETNKDKIKKTYR